MHEQTDTITSTSNPLIKMLKSLERKKGRAETGLFLAEGARLVEQGMTQGWEAEIVLIADTMAERSHLKTLAQKARAKGARVILVPERVMSRVTRKENAQSIVAAFRQRHLSLTEFDGTKSGVWIALYEVRDPGNLGTILRTADCAGVNGVILIGSCCDPYSFEAVRASMGSVFDMPFSNTTFGEFDNWRVHHDASLSAASVNGTARHDQTEYGDRAVIIMGNEQAGLPDTVETACDSLVLIPMRGGADSLNLAQATAIMTYEVWRQKDFTS